MQRATPLKRPREDKQTAGSAKKQCTIDMRQPIAMPMEIAQSPETKDITPLLQTALKYVLNTCILGASNKFSDIKKTNGWNANLRFFTSPGEYRNRSKYFPDKFDERTNQFFAENKMEKTISTEWFYHLKKTKEWGMEFASYSKRDAKFDPIEDTQFKLEENQKIMLYHSLFVLETRFGNCGARAFLLAKYLWEHKTGIHRIEIVVTETFDHCLVIINRNDQSSLQIPNTWGSAWVVDAWYGDDGLIFPAHEFTQKIQIIKAFAKEQYIALKNLGITTIAVDESKPEVLKNVVCEIFPSKTTYPTYSLSPFYPLEYYYKLSHPADKKEHLEEHKQKFKGCLEEIKKLRR